ncbi:MAG: CBS domain-containing protein [Hyphomicrobiales bacterium]|nr:MAG: CBS domain-containing protein [Hyphomicrobiales bacterium]
MTDVPLIRDYMARDLTTLTPETEINHAMHLLLERGFSGAPVLNEAGWLVGILSKRDCLKAALNASYFREWGETVEDYMTKDMKTLDSEMDIVEAAKAFIASPYRRFPVLSDGKLVGQVSRTDILKALSDQWA